MNKKFKIILSAGIFPPDIGGPATYVEKLATEFIEKGMDVEVITYSDENSSKFEVHPVKSPLKRGARSKSEQFNRVKSSKFKVKVQNYDFPVIRISRKIPKGLRHFLYFWRLLKLAKDADLIYVQNAVSAGLPALLVSKILNKRLIIKVVGDYAWEQYINKVQNSKHISYRPSWRTGSKFKVQGCNIEEFQKKKFDLITEIRRKVQKIVAKNAEFIITPSKYIKRLVQGWGVEKNKIKVVYNAIEQEKLIIPKKEAKQKIGISGKIILSVGRLVPNKGFDSLIEIMSDILKQSPDLKLVIIGEGPELKNLQSLISNFQLEDKVKLIGKVKHSDMPLYYRAADIFVLNTAQEGLSHTLLEAMQYELPIVTTKVGGNPEIVEDGVNGFLTDYNDKEALKKSILKLIKDKKLQNRFIKISKKKLKNFTWDNLIKQTIEVLKRGY